MPDRDVHHHAEQQFGRTVGAILVLIGAWLLWHNPESLTGLSLVAVGGTLITLGILFPRLLAGPNLAWMKLANILGFISSRVILSLIFFLVVTPIGLIKRWSGWDPLSRRASPHHSYWTPYPERLRNPKHFEKMY